MKEKESESKKDNKTEEIKQMQPITANGFKFPIINIRRATTLAESTVNYFLLGLCFSIYSFSRFNWFKVNEINNKNYTMANFLFVGVCLCVLSLYDWYQGRTISFLLNFNFGLLYIVYYTDTNNLFDNPKDAGKSDIKLEAIFYILWFSFLFFVIICSKDKGILFIIDYIFLFIGYVFIFIYKYWLYEWVDKAVAYAFLVIAAFFWITGILKLLNDISMFRSNPLVEPAA